MSSRQDSHITMNRRMALIAAGKVALFGALLSRLFYLQVIKNDYYTNLAEGNRIKIKFITPLRGEILDRTGAILASNRPTYFLNITAEEVPDLEKTLNDLKKLISKELPDNKKLLRRIRATPRFLPVTVAEDINWEDVCSIEVRLLDLPGLSVEEGHIRSYIFSEAFAHSIGHVHLVAPNDKITNEYKKIPNFHIGKVGIEKQKNQELLGVPGIREVEVNAYRREVRELSIKPSISGKETKLTLHKELQLFVYETLCNQQSGSCVVMDAQNGDVLAMVSAPGFDPNVFSSGISSKVWRDLLQNPNKPLLDKVTTGLYPPGSVFKPMVALAALETNTVVPHVHCNGEYHLGNHIFHCWKDKGHGHMNIVSAMEHSCDVYFYVLAQKVGIDPIVNMASKFGFGHLSSMDFPGEKSGLLPSRQWKRLNKNQPWTTGDTILTSIGQGYWQATPLQMAIMMARLASGRKTVPRMFFDEVHKPFESLGIKQESLDVVLEGMWRAVNTWGTAHRSNPNIENFEAIAKTGTSQVRRITARERELKIKNKDLPWLSRDHALVVAAAPYKNLRFAISVVIDHGGGGGATAAPIAGEILKKIHQLKL